MSTIRRIPTSQIDGNEANTDNPSEIRPYGEIGLYEGNNNKLELLISDGQRTHFKSKVLAKGTFYGGDADSADGNNYDTIKLIPDVTLVQNDGNHQYVVVDPTEPNHVHIRAGGPIDDSNAELIIGGENSNVKIGNVRILINMLNTKNIGSKFLIISFTGNVFTVDLQLRLSISFIPKCFALPIPFLYLSRNIAVV